VSTPLEAKLGHTFRHRALLSEALTHRSYGTPHNERLEFIGDSALNCVVACALFSRFPSLAEGQLSRMRASLVSREPLTRIAAQLGLAAYLRLGDGEERSGGRERPSILADATEALFGAVMVDDGFVKTQSVILSLLDGEMAELRVDTNAKDAKTELQEWLQARKLPRPEYTVLDVLGAQHAQTFRVQCAIAQRNVLAVGEGYSRRVAEQAAATAAFAQLKGGR
jgi:ribonuclease-3